jgi:CHAT domain-containing protein/Tfp pilus assembly protein PilF
MADMTPHGWLHSGSAPRPHADIRPALKWITVAVLCCAAGAVAEEKRPDQRHLQAQAAYDEAKRLSEAGEYALAMKQGEHALVLAEAALGGSDPFVAGCLELLGSLHRLQGEFAQAEPLHQRALAILEQALGKSHPDVGKALHNLAILYLDQGLYTRAEPLYERALAIREQALGKSHPDVAASLNNLGMLYSKQGLFARAEPLYERALAILEQALGNNHPHVAALLNNLAELYRNQGLYARAGPLYERALVILEQVLGKSHPHVASSLNNLGMLYAQQGLYAQAEPLYERALAIWEQVLGKNHPDLATSLNNLANLYFDQGLYARAEPLHERVLAILEQALGKSHPDLATSLNNLAMLYSEQGLYARAEPLFERALAIREQGLGKGHPDVAASLNNLAKLYSKQGLYARAEPLCQRALAISEQALGKNHPVVAQLLNNLAEIHRSQGLYARARPLHERALAIQEQALGKNHPDVATSLNHLALLHVAQHRLAGALPLFTRAFSISERRLRQEALVFSETRLTRFLEYLRADEEVLYALLRAYPKNEDVRRLALSAVLLLKGRSVEELATTSRTIYRSMGAEDRDAFERLRALRSQLATLSFQDPVAQPLAEYQQRLNELTTQGDALEAGLAKRSAALRALTGLPSPSEIVHQTAAALPKESALVEFISYEDRPLVQRGMPRSQRPSQLRYLALVLSPHATLRAIDLGPAEPIDHAASSLRQALASPGAAFQARAQALYKRAFQPLLPLLGGARRLFLSPDGQLGLVPFSALHDGQRFLIDTYDFTYLTSGRDLLPRPQDAAPSGPVAVLADPDFAVPLQVPASSSEDTPRQAGRSASVERLFSMLRANLGDSPWEPLPGTRQEAQAIQRLIPNAQLFLGPEATKERLLQLPTPSVLHIATHGFFLEDAPTPKDSRAVNSFGALSVGPPAQLPSDPLLRSGLILAGAQALASKSSSSAAPPLDSAVVTALELAGLDLWGTELVVLSACNTGSGDVKRGQGVYGLRRALVVAGAETVVMSLWKVSDNSTSQLMEAYYRNLLAGQGRASALREAMRALRLSQPHPHYWAPFIVLGRDTPLRTAGL